MNASGYCESHLKNGELTLVLDFLHEEKNMEERMFSLFNTCKNKQISTALKTLFPESIAAFLLAKAEISQEKPVHFISKKERQNLCQQIKSLELTVTGLKTKEAMITQRGN